jgi:uncharacterized SAM-binding protein YcdF (DUF218 family)
MNEERINEHSQAIVPNDKRRLLKQAKLAFIIAAAVLIAGLGGGFGLRGARFLRQIAPVAAAVFALYGAFCVLQLRRRWTRWLRRIWLAAAVLFIAAFIAVEIAVAVNDKSDIELDEPPPAQYIIVLGAGLNKGYVPSAALTSRLETAREYLSRHREVVCVVSGGQGEDETVSEASAMKLWLTEHEIEAERILTEDKSRNTAENIKFSLSLLREQDADFDTVIVCSNGYHLMRAKMIIRQNGAKAFALDAPDNPPYLAVLGYFREFFSIVLMER